jgi:hypothetical protein
LYLDFFSVPEIPSSSQSRGDLAYVTSEQFPILNGLSLQRLVLEDSIVREPNWFTNANALGYCF